MSPTSTHEDAGLIPSLAQWVRIQRCPWAAVCISEDSDLALLWPWHRLAAVTTIWPLAWEYPYAAGASFKEKKKEKEINPTYFKPLKYWGCLLMQHLLTCPDRVLVKLLLYPRNLGSALSVSSHLIFIATLWSKHGYCLHFYMRNLKHWARLPKAAG